MRIKQLEIDNFKSFANQNTIPFLDGFTVVSGPNGSGKSNIIDCILFALGLSTSRELRSEQGAGDLISTHNKRNEASVRVTFALDDEDELIITRKIKRTSHGVQSTYYMNDKQCTFTQVCSELEKYNITSNSHNVIMQGHVTTIANCSPKERRQYLDEIAGTADFDRKIAAAQKELETVEARVQNSLIIKNEKDARLEELKEEREIALKYKTLNDEKLELEGKVSVIKYFDTKRSLDLVHQNILTSTKEIKVQNVRLDETKSKIEDKTAKYKEICEMVRAQGEDKQLEVKKLLEEKKGEISRKETSIAHSEKLILDNKKTAQNAQNGIENLTKKKEEIICAIEQKEKLTKEQEELLEKKKAQLAEILMEMSGLNKTADEHIERRNFLRKELDGLKDKETELIKTKLPLENELSNLQKELSETNKAIEELEEGQKTFDDKRDKLELQIQTLQKELDECKTVQKITFEDLDKTRTQLQDLEHSIQLSHKKIATLEANKQAYKTIALGAGVETIMSAHLEGVHAPLMQLAEVDGEFADAIDVAMGGRSRFVVVEDENVAARAIQLLKSQGRDRATFLPLNKIKKAPSRLSLPKDDGVIDFAINLIDFDDKYIDAFYFALGETIVVESLDCAKRLMSKYRVVTLEGDIFEKTGAITGGARKRSTSTFGKAEDRELETFKKRLKAFEIEYSELEKKRNTLDKRLEQVRADYSNASNVYNSAKYELQNLIKVNSGAKENIEKKFARINEITPKIKENEKKLDSMEASHVDLLDKIAKVQDEIQEVEKLIDEGELKELKEKTQGVENEIREIERKILNIQSDIEKEKNNIKFHDMSIKQRQDDIVRTNEENLKLEEDKKKYAKEIEDLKVVLKEYEEKIEELGKNLVQFQKQRDEAQQELLELEKTKNNIEAELDRINEQIESSKARRRELEPLLEQTAKELEEAGINLKEIEPTEISLDEINSKIQKLQKKIEALGLVNMRAINDYENVANTLNELTQRIETLEKERVEILERMKGYETNKKEEFLKTYNAVNQNFKDIFPMLSEGEGELVLENPNDPFSGGLVFRASIRDKKNQKLAAMSGGEKTLTALAFVFAVQRYLPAPFYAFDEVDMHLDGPNVEKLAKMINIQAKQTQFIVVSLRKPMIDSADRMIGVTQKGRGVTKISGVGLKEEVLQGQE